MSARLDVELMDPGTLKGVKGIDVIVNGDVAGEAQFGATVSIDVASGSQKVSLRLRGVVTRNSKPVTITVTDGATKKLVGKYSKLWGSIGLREA